MRTDELQRCCGTARCGRLCVEGAHGKLLDVLDVGVTGVFWSQSVVRSREQQQWDVGAALTVPASETKRACQAIGGNLREVVAAAVVVISCLCPVRPDVLLTACLTSSAANATGVDARAQIS